MNTYSDIETVEALTAEGYSREAVEALIDQVVTAGLEITDQPDNGVILTAAEVDVIRAQLSLENDDEVGDLYEAVIAVDDAEAALTEARGRRDAQIRAALANGLSYQRVGEVTGMTRQHLDRIRRANQ